MIAFRFNTSDASFAEKYLKYIQLKRIIQQDTDTDTLLKFKQQTCMNRPIQLTIQ